MATLRIKDKQTNQWKDIIGLKGEKGDKGDKGEKGDTGIQGPQGPKGDTGSQGPQGIQGIQGPQGIPGKDFSITNTYASTALMYADKDNVSVGEFVMISSTVDDPDNASLYVRNTSVAGFGFVADLSGAQGIKGDKGDKGDQGIQGIQGETGATGPQGPAGQNGTNGVTPHIDPTTKHWMIGETDTNVVAEGVDGTNGTDGQDGQDGQDGITPHIDSTTGNWFIGSTDTNIHAQGPQGIQGPAGQDGANGQDGQDGYSPIATVTKLGTITTISITDKNGTTTAQVNDGEGGTSYVPTLNAAPTSSTTTYTKDGQTVDFEIGQFCRVPKTGGGYDFYQLYDLQTEGNVTTATWKEVGELPSNVAYISSDSGEGIIPSDGIRAETVTSAATMSINPDVVTVINGSVGTAAITLQVPNDNLAHVWDILMTTDSSVAITFAMSNSATILYPNGFSVGASKAVEFSVIGVGTKYYLRYGEFA